MFFIYAYLYDLHALVVLCIVMCGQYETWSVGRSGGHEKRRGRKVAEDGQAENKEAEIKIDIYVLVVVSSTS